jgi:hypothetical protein
MVKIKGKKEHKDGTLSESLLDSPRGILMDKEDNLIISDKYRIRKINFQSQQIQTIAGDARYQRRYDKIPVLNWSYFI